MGWDTFFVRAAAFVKGSRSQSPSHAPLIVGATSPHWTVVANKPLQIDVCRLYAWDDARGRPLNANPSITESLSETESYTQLQYKRADVMIQILSNDMDIFVLKHPEYTKILAQLRADRKGICALTEDIACRLTPSVKTVVMYVDVASLTISVRAVPESQGKKVAPNLVKSQ